MGSVIDRCITDVNQYNKYTTQVTNNYCQYVNLNQITQGRAWMVYTNKYYDSVHVTVRDFTH